MILVEGGEFINKNSNYFGKKIIVPSFYIGKYEVTQKEWKEIMGNNPSKFQGDDLPVETVAWYDCLEYCNKKSVKDGLKPVYVLDKENKDPQNEIINDRYKWTIKTDFSSDGYRLPSELEWEYAASGGNKSGSFVYSGSNDINEVSWNRDNSDYTPHQAGTKKPNELGIYDMSGNISEWCYDWFAKFNEDFTPPETGFNKVFRGGNFSGMPLRCKTSDRIGGMPSSPYYGLGFRIVKNK